MRLLLDNCVPQRLAQHISGHEVTTVVKLGWAAMSDGALLAAMAGRYDVLVTVDRSIQYQQRLHDRTFAVVVLRARSNHISVLLQLVPELLDRLATILPGQVREISD